jgi:hypothetical protein
MDPAAKMQKSFYLLSRTGALFGKIGFSPDLQPDACCSTFLIYAKALIPRSFPAKNLIDKCAHSLKCSRDLSFEIIHIPFPQPVDISGSELSDRKDIFVNRLTFC